MTTTKKVWDRRGHATQEAVPDKNSVRKDSVLGDRIKVFKSRFDFRKRSPEFPLSNHEFVIATRAARLGITVKQYVEKFCK